MANPPGPYGVPHNPFHIHIQNVNGIPMSAPPASSQAPASPVPAAVPETAPRNQSPWLDPRHPPPIGTIPAYYTMAGYPAVAGDGYQMFYNPNAAEPNAHQQTVLKNWNLPAGKHRQTQIQSPTVPALQMQMKPYPIIMRFGPPHVIQRSDQDPGSPLPLPVGPIPPRGGPHGGGRGSAGPPCPQSSKTTSPTPATVSAKSNEHTLRYREIRPTCQSPPPRSGSSSSSSSSSSSLDDRPPNHTSRKSCTAGISRALDRVVKDSDAERIRRGEPPQSGFRHVFPPNAGTEKAKDRGGHVSGKKSSLKKKDSDGRNGRTADARVKFDENVEAWSDAGYTKSSDNPTMPGAL